MSSTSSTSSTKSSTKSSAGAKATFLWVLIVATVSIGIFIYLIKDDSPATKSVIELSYFADEAAIADSVLTELNYEIKKNKYYWLGLEPEKNEHVELASRLIQKLQSEHKFTKIIVDRELGLKSDKLKQLGFTDMVAVKENLYALGEKLQEFEKAGISYILVSASIYTNSLLKKNPYNILNEKYKLRPLTFSFAYLPTRAQDEKNMTFSCRSTEDQTGTSDWGCAVVNRSRFVRKKIVVNAQKPWVGLMDLTAENSYVIILKKNDQ